mmetsp:Transcript_5274/g.19787  ORF Transcript_5274/g.19787 Transcript_5274/m.19787 type:complete len:465 (+) Transcript_5274:979-2373(+)
MTAARRSPTRSRSSSTRPSAPASPKVSSTARRSPSSSGRAASAPRPATVRTGLWKTCMSVRVVEQQLEGIEIAQPAPGGLGGDAAVEQQRHLLLGQAAMRAQRHVQRAEVVALGCGAEHAQALADDDDVADAVGRQLEAGGGLLLRQHQLDTGQFAHRRHRVGGAVGVDGREGAQRAMVDDIGVGDGQDDAGRALAQRGVQRRLQIGDAGFAGGIGLGVHAVVGGQRKARAEGVELAEVAVQHRVEGIGARRARRAFVLDVVGGGQIDHVRLAGPQQGHAGSEHELAQRGAVDAGQRQADEAEGVVEAAVGPRGLVGLLGREADAAAQAVAEQAAQLVLGGDDRDAQARIRERCQQRGRAQVFRLVHHHFAAGLAVQEVVARDAVHGRRRAGDDGQVVRVGEGRHHRVGHQGAAGLQDALQLRHQAGQQGLRDVVGLAAVDAQHDDRPVRNAVAAAVDGQGRGA